MFGHQVSRHSKARKVHLSLLAAVLRRGVGGAGAPALPPSIYPRMTFRRLIHFFPLPPIHPRDLPPTSSLYRAIATPYCRLFYLVKLHRAIQRINSIFHLEEHFEDDFRR